VVCDVKKKMKKLKNNKVILSEISGSPNRFVLEVGTTRG